MQNPHEDQSVDRTHEDYQNAADLFPSLAAAQNNQAAAPQNSPRPASRNRRKFISLLAVGTVGLVTAVTVGGVSFAKEIEGRFDSEDGKGHGLSVTRQRGDGDDNDDHDNDWDDDHPRKTPTPSKPTPQPTKAPGSTPTPQPTKAPGSTPTPAPTPKPTGTVIGSTTMATNSVVAFTNPADGQPSWLVHMGNGNFVAVEQACTHAGVSVKYNPNTGQFNCPAHGAIFNADGTNPQAPATLPLPPVHITVNSNGTITVP